MKCPKCGSTHIREGATFAAVINADNWACTCLECHTRFTNWQQAELDSLQARVAEGLRRIEALALYVEHRPYCKSRCNYAGKDNPYKCNCGLTEAVNPPGAELEGR